MVRRRLVLVALVLGAVAAVAEIGGAADYGVPLPADVAVVPPAPDVPQALAAFSGVWAGGRWDSVQAHVLVVEKVSANGEAGVVYAWADLPDGRAKGGWSRRSGKIANGELTVSLQRFDARYRFDEQGHLQNRLGIGLTAALSKTSLAALPGVMAALATLGDDLAPVERRRVALDDGRIVVAFPESMPARMTVDDLVRAVGYADEDVRRLFKLEKRAYDINFIGVVARGRSEGARASISVPFASLKSSHRTIWHEIVHTYTTRDGDVLARRPGRGNIGSYRTTTIYVEGLAVWVDSRVREKVDLHDRVRKAGYHALGTPLTVSTNFDFNDERGYAYAHYQVAGSFVQYLIEDVLKNDLDRFMAFYRSHQTDYEQSFGRSFDALAKGWLDLIGPVTVTPTVSKDKASTPAPVTPGR
jgi:hypothetical protein